MGQQRRSKRLARWAARPSAHAVRPLGGCRLACRASQPAAAKADEAALCGVPWLGSSGDEQAFTRASRSGGWPGPGR